MISSFEDLVDYTSKEIGLKPQLTKAFEDTKADYTSKEIGLKPQRIISFFRS